MILNEGESPGICYLSKSRSVFTMKNLLETVLKQQGTDDLQPMAAKRTYEHVWIFYRKKIKESWEKKKSEIKNRWYNAEICMQISQ